MLFAFLGRGISPPPSLSLFLCLSACLVCFSHFPQAKPSQAKANAADAFFWARNKIDPGKSRLEINLARPAQAAGGTWAAAAAVVCVCVASQSAQKVAGAKRLLSRPLAASSAKVRIILCLPATSAGKMQYRMQSPCDPSPTHNKDHTKRTELQSQRNTTKKSALQQQQQQQANSERFSIKRNCCSMWILCLLD